MEDWSIHEFLNNIEIYLIIKDEIEMMEKRRKELRLGILNKLKELGDKAETTSFIAEREIHNSTEVLQGAVDFMSDKGLERYLDVELVAKLGGLESARLNEDITDEEFDRFVNKKPVEHLIVKRKEEMMNG